MVRKAVVAGVGMTPFVKPGTEDVYDVMAEQAMRAALKDAGISYGDVQQVFAGYVYGDSTCGQTAAYRIGLTGVPIFNINNNCATGSSALFLARQAVASGSADCVLALGFEQMSKGAIAEIWNDRTRPLERFVTAAAEARGESDAPLALFLFGSAGAEYQEKFGISDEAFAMVSVKARRHAQHNEKAIFRNLVSVEEVLASPKLYGPLTRLQACPPTCGAAAAIICSEAFAKRYGLDGTVYISGQAMRTDYTSSFEEKSAIKVVGYDLSKQAANAAYTEAGLGPHEIQVAELHDCFTVNEILTYEAVGLAPEGDAEAFIMNGENTYGGRVVTNSSGGLLSKGHPLGATGLAQCTEIVDQLRHRAGKRQVPNARVGMQHNLGLGGACVVTIYQRA